MSSLVQLKSQALALMEDQKTLINDASRTWDAKRPEFEKVDADIKAVLEQYKALKAVSGSASMFNAMGDPTRTPATYELRGVQRGVAAAGYQPIEAPQLELDDDAVKELHDAAIARKSYGVTSKAATDSTSVPQSTVTDYHLSPVSMRREPTRILSLIPSFSTASPSVTWYSTTGTAAAAAVAEGGVKPTSTIAYTPQTSTVTKIAHVAEVTDETLADFPAFLGVLTQDMFDGLVKAENDELMNASTAGAHKFGGLLNTTGILLGTPVPASPNQTDRLDAIGAAFDQLRVSASFAEPDGIIMHPQTWGTMKRNKDSQNRYLLSDPGSATDPRIWGVPVVTTTQCPVGTVLAGAFRSSTTAYIREGIRIETNNSGEAQFKANTTLVRAEERLTLTVPRPSGLIKVTGF